MQNDNVLRGANASEAGRGLPPEILAIAQATRDKFAADERTGQTWGNVKSDDPATCGQQPLTSAIRPAQQPLRDVTD